MKIFLLFYMCHFAMGLTHCYKTTVFFTWLCTGRYAFYDYIVAHQMATLIGYEILYIQSQEGDYATVLAEFALCE